MSPTTILPTGIFLESFAQDWIRPVGDNPLREPYQRLLAEGIDSLLAYLRDLTNAHQLYEAKLLVVGEGNVGKSCLVTALKGGEFDKDRETTHGIEIGSFCVENQRMGEPIQINAWDFGGQEVYRVTHQFFGSSGESVGAMDSQEPSRVPSHALGG